MKKEHSEGKILSSEGKRLSIEIIPTMFCSVVDGIVLSLFNLGIRRIDYRHIKYGFLVVELPDDMPISKFQKDIKKANSNIKGLSFLPDNWEIMYRDFSYYSYENSPYQTLENHISAISRKFMYEDQVFFNNPY